MPIMPMRTFEEMNFLQKIKNLKSVKGKIIEKTLKIWLKKMREQLTLVI